MIISHLHVRVIKVAASPGRQGAPEVGVVVEVVVQDGGRHVGEPLEVVGQAGGQHGGVHWTVFWGHPRELAVELGHVRLIPLR